MQRFTISLDDELAMRFGEWIARNHYGTRSEAIRDLLRERLGEESLKESRGAPQAQFCVASVVYVYDHHERELGRRLVQHQHAHAELSVATLHVHLDADTCLEVAILRGATSDVEAEAQSLVAERGVRFGKVHKIPLTVPGGHHHREPT